MRKLNTNYKIQIVSKYVAKISDSLKSVKYLEIHDRKVKQNISYEKCVPEEMVRFQKTLINQIFLSNVKTS